jgi:hypothetical protein
VTYRWTEWPQGFCIILKIAVAVLRPGENVPAVEVISHDGEMVRRLIGKFADRSVLAACYEPGRAAMSCTGCWPRRAWRATWSRRRLSRRGPRTGSRPTAGTACGWRCRTGPGLLTAVLKLFLETGMELAASGLVEHLPRSPAD